MEYEVLNLIDELDDIQFVSEMNVINSMMDVYMKQAIMLEYASDEVVQECCVVQESLKDEIKSGMKGLEGKSTIKKILLFIPTLIKSFITWVIKCFKKIKSRKMVETIDEAVDTIDEMAPEDREWFIKEFMDDINGNSDEITSNKNPSYNYNKNHKYEITETNVSDQTRDDYWRYQNANNDWRAYESFRGMAIPNMEKFNQYLHLEESIADDIDKTVKTIPKSGIDGPDTDWFKQFSHQMEQILDRINDDLITNKDGYIINFVDDWTGSSKAIRKFTNEFVNEFEPKIDNILIPKYTKLSHTFALGNKAGNAIHTLDGSDDERDTELLKIMKRVRRHISNVIDKTTQPIKIVVDWYQFALKILLHRKNLKHKTSNIPDVQKRIAEKKFAKNLTSDDINISDIGKSLDAAEKKNPGIKDALNNIL